LFAGQQLENSALDAFPLSAPLFPHGGRLASAHIYSTVLGGSARSPGALAEILPDFEPGPTPIHIILPFGRFIAAVTRALVEFIANAFANDPSLN
jgi:hypothetical protein